jgi:hypothetical protein
LSLGTYAQLQASVADWATKTSLTTQIPDFIAWAHQEICRKLRCPLLYARATLTVNAETIAAPTGFLATKRFYLDTTPRRVLRLTDSAQLVDMTMDISTCDYPSHFAVEGTSTLAFAPLFSGSVSAEMLYYEAPTAMVAGGDTNVVLAKYPFLYLYGALEALFRYMEDDNNADRYGGQFGALIGSINAEEAKDALRGPLVGSAGGAVV